MIIIAGQLIVNPAIVSEMVATIAAMREKVLAEPGCHFYSLLMEDAADGIVNVLEMWEDDAALALHLTQPWVVDFVDRFAGEMQGSTAQIYDVASVRALPALNPAPSA